MHFAAAVQMTSSADKEANLATALALVEQAARRGATLVGLPENVLYMGPERDKPRIAEPLDGPSMARFAAKARELQIYLLAGSFPESGAPGGRFFNTTVLFDPRGEAVGVYRKIHLFDVDIPDGARYRESETVAPGEHTVVVETELGRIGLSICYDLRFPELFRALAEQGAEIVLVPAAFTLHTGRDHWEVLLRARAIENQCFVVAPAQYGRHSENRVTYGHALVANPWGTVLATAADGPGVALAPIDRELLAQVRRDLPALTHRRL